MTSDQRSLALEFGEMERQARQRKITYSQGTALWNFHEGREMAFRDCRLTVEQGSDLPSLVIDRNNAAARAAYEATQG